MKLFNCLKIRLILVVFVAAIVLGGLAQAGVVIDVPSGDTAALIAAIHTANAAGGGTINLEVGIYTLTAVDNDTVGPNGLPSITGEIVINGHGSGISVIERSAAAPPFRIFHVSSGAMLTLQNVTVRGGDIPDGTTFWEGTGGGIYSVGHLTLKHSTVSGNQTQSGDGGGIESHLNSTLIIENSSVFDNTGGDGGGITLGRATQAIIVNSTIANNHARAHAGGIQLWGTGPTAITGTTISGNSADGFGGGLIIVGSAANIQNTIIAGNSAVSDGPDCYLSFVSEGNNIVGDMGGCGTVLQSTDLVGDPHLGLFVDPGTAGGAHFPLLPGSPAIDAGNDEACLDFDQLGNARVDGDGDGIVTCDIGAVEFAPANIIHVPGDFPSIQQAIDAAVDGDTVLVSPGTYMGRINFNGKKIEVRSESGPNVTTIYGGALYQSSESEDSLLEGFMIIGAEEIWNASSPTIKNCYLKGEGTFHGGGHGTIIGNSSPTFIDCQIYQGRAGIGGGYDVHNSSATFIRCRFFENVADSGGGLYIRNSEVHLNSCTFVENEASVNGGGIYGINSLVAITHCSFSNNKGNRGGAIRLSDSSAHSSIINTNFLENYASWDGGGVNNSSSRLSITSCLFQENYSGGGGGGIYNEYYGVTITNCVFATNGAYYSGGGIVNENSSSIITNCTFYQNYSESSVGCGIHDWNNSDSVVTNCILWGNYICMEAGHVQFCDIDQDGFAGGDGNIREAPLFVDPENGDYHLKSQAGRWDPNSESWVQDDVTSPCIDAGDPMSPIGLEPFPNGGFVNMGAYGGAPKASKSYFGEPICETIVAGDINGDCQVDRADLAIMALHWTDDEPLPLLP